MAIRNSHFSLQEYLNVVVVVVSILEITYSAFGKRISREVFFLCVYVGVCVRVMY